MRLVPGEGAVTSVFLVHHADDGTPLCGLALGGAGTLQSPNGSLEDYSNIGTGLAVSPEGHVWVTGRVVGETRFHPYAHAHAATGADAFLMRYDGKCQAVE